MPNVSNFGAQTDNAVVQGTVTDRAMVVPDIPPSGLMSVGPRITPHFVKPSLWSALTTYHFFDAVHDAAGASYVAIKPEVPAGTELTDEGYWFLWADPNSQLADLNELVKTFNGRITQNTADIATKAPNNHASEETTYGVGNEVNYGHVRLATEDTPTTSDANAGIAATPKTVIDSINNIVEPLNVINLTDYNDPDFSTKLNRAIEDARTSFINSSGNAAKSIIIIPSGKYTLNSTVTVSPYCKLVFLGRCIIENYAQVSFLFTHSEGDLQEEPNERESWLKTPWIQGSLVMKNKVVGATAFEIGSRVDLTSSFPTSRYTLKDFVLEGFTTCILINSINNYIGTFDNFHLLDIKDVGIKYGANTSVLTKNAGERFTFSNFIIESYCTAIQTNSATFQCDIHNASFDYVETVFEVNNKNNWFALSQVHFEGIKNAIVGNCSGDTCISIANSYIGMSTETGIIVNNTINPLVSPIISIKNSVIDYFAKFPYNTYKAIDLVKGNCIFNAEVSYTAMENYPLTYKNSKIKPFKENSSVNLSSIIDGYTITPTNTEPTASVVKSNLFDGVNALKVVKGASVEESPSILVEKTIDVEGGRCYGILPLVKNRYKPLRYVNADITFDSGEKQTVTFEYYDKDTQEEWTIPYYNQLVCVPPYAKQMTVKTRVTFDYTKNDLEFAGFMLTQAIM